VTVRVVVLTEDPEGPSARHRWVYPRPHLEAAGIELEILPVQPKAERPAAFRAAAAADLTVVHRKLFRVVDFLRLVRSVRGGGGRLVYDLDDAVMYRPPGRKRQWSLLRRLRFARIVRQASLFLPGNRYLAEQAPQRVTSAILPTPVDTSRYAPREEVPERGRTVVWIGTRATLRYLHGIAAPLAELGRRRRDLVLRVIGPPPGELPGVTVEHSPWTEETEAARIAEADVGVLPLTDDAWSRGKCAFKALQYMAAGLPVVASPVGMNRRVVESGVSGYLARADSEWVSFLERILDGPVLREAMGKAGRRRAEERYDLAVLGRRLARLLLGVAP